MLIQEMEDECASGGPDVFDDPASVYSTHHRYYDPVAGRFLTQDPTEDDPDNDYRYVRNNPVNRTDPTGFTASTYVGSPTATSAGSAQSSNNWPDDGAVTTVSPQLIQLQAQIHDLEGRKNYAASQGDAATEKWLWDELQISKQQMREQFNALTPSTWEYTKAYASGAKYGATGGASIVANTFTFGASDYVGLTDSEQYQGRDFTGSRIAATVSREAFITAATLGTAQIARGGIQGTSWSAQAINYAAQSRRVVLGARIATNVITTYDVASGGYQVGSGIDRVAEGDNWGYVDIAAGGFRGVGGIYSAKQLQVTQRLQGHVDRAVSQVDAGGVNALTFSQRTAGSARPGLLPAFRGNRIDVIARDAIESDRWLPPLNSNYRKGPDFANSIGEWWDMTTPGQWASHVQKYGADGVRLATEGR